MIFIYLISLLSAVIGVPVSQNHQRRGGVLPPNYSDLDNAPPRPDQTAGVICNIGQFSKTNDIDSTARDQVDGPYGYLAGISGTAEQEPGPGKCTRVSCAWDLGVYICNDNTHKISVAWKDIATYVNDIGMTCGGGMHLPNSTGRDSYGTDYFDFTKSKPTNGQKFSSEKWNVYINGDKC
ncbi:hypothetical protein D9757_009936 [Collybiopsis confluens]|uniref:Uncharacterized protein n=1 Tax=Collybiopsis confluens TaxID=2823264 RepID=A0A8H5LZQ0_9AGAR|nr:hypothetical protein D9757_009936 [Collybiopsis confluens]